MLKISTTPHIFSPVTTQSLMRDVLIALTPAIIVALLMFGIGALKVLLTSASCLNISLPAICSKQPIRSETALQ